MGIQILKTDEYEAWFRRLLDRQAQARINARIRLCETAGQPVGDVKPVSGGVNEMRFHFGPGYRVYFAQKGDQIMLLLAGGTKQGQQRDIEAAINMLRELKEEHRW